MTVMVTGWRVDAEVQADYESQRATDAMNLRATDAAQAKIYFDFLHMRSMKIPSCLVGLSLAEWVAVEFHPCLQC
jgi:hypothetical protein